MLNLLRLPATLRTNSVNVYEFYVVITFRLCVLRTNGDFYLVQNKQFGFYNRGGGCLQRGRDWVLK